MADTSDFKNGMCIEFNHDIYQIVEFLHVKPGKGAAFVRTKLKSMTNGKVLENTFPSGAKVKVVRVETREYQFLYKDDLGYHFMDKDSFDQVTVEEKLVDGYRFLKDGMDVLALFNTDTDTVMGVELPANVTMQVTYTEPGVRGDTASGGSQKPAEVETGTTIMVPLFVNTGEFIKVDTRTGSYVERVKV